MSAPKIIPDRIIPTYPKDESYLKLFDLYKRHQYNLGVSMSADEIASNNFNRTIFESNKDKFDLIDSREQLAASKHPDIYNKYEVENLRDKINGTEYKQQSRVRRSDLYNGYNRKFKNNTNNKIIFNLFEKRESYLKSANETIERWKGVVPRFMQIDKSQAHAIYADMFDYEEKTSKIVNRENSRREILRNKQRRNIPRPRIKLPGKVAPSAMAPVQPRMVRNHYNRKNNIQPSVKPSIAASRRAALKRAEKPTSNVYKASSSKRKQFIKSKGNPNFTSKTFTALGNAFKTNKKLAVGALLATAFVGASVGVHVVNNKISELTYRNDKLPSKYTDGYKEMNSYMSDFGSPVNLLKTASKVINKPINSTRHSMMTNTNAIMNSNIALYSSKHAINHTRF